MSYRLITKATLVITPATGEAISAIAEVRAYPAPKRPASGNLTVDGTSVDFRRTGGKGRGLLNRQYVYFPLGNESAYIEVTDEQATAITAGAAIAITSIATSDEESDYIEVTDAQATSDKESDATSEKEVVAAVEAPAQVPNPVAVIQADAPSRAARRAKK